VLSAFSSIASSSQPASSSLASPSVPLPSLTTNSLFQQVLTTNNNDLVTSLQNQITMQNARIQQLEAQLAQKADRPKATKRRYAETNSSSSTREATPVPATTAAPAAAQSQEEGAMKPKTSFKK